MSGMIFDEIHERLKLWETTYPTGELDLVAELAQIVGKIVVAASIGKEYHNQELPYKHLETGRNEMMNIGNFLNKTLGDAAIRDGQAINVFFPELLQYCLTPYDRNFQANHQTLIAFFKRVKTEKLA